MITLIFSWKKLAWNVFLLKKLNINIFEKPQNHKKYKNQNLGSVENLQSY